MKGRAILARVGQAALGGVAVVSVLALATAVAVMFLVLVSDLTLLKRLQTVLAAGTGIGIVVAVGRYLFTRWNRFALASDGRVTTATVRLLQTEPLLIPILWVAIAVQAVALSFVLEIYTIRVIVHVENAGPEQPPSITSDAPKFGPGELTDNRWAFKSNGQVRWGTSLDVWVVVDGHDSAQTSFAWPTTAFLRATRGIDVEVRPVRRFHLVSLTAEPATATISLRSGMRDTVFTGGGQWRLWEGYLTVQTEAPNHDTDTRVRLVTGDTVWPTIRLRRSVDRRPGVLVLDIRNPGQERVVDLGVWIDGARQADRVESYDLAPGTHTVSLCRDLGDGGILVVDPFEVVIVAGQTRTDTVVITERTGPCPSW